MIWATVSDRDLDLLKTQPFPTVLIKPLSEFNSLSDTEVILQLTRAGGTTLMVESPQFFLAFRHVLDTLQVRVIVDFNHMQYIHSELVRLKKNYNINILLLHVKKQNLYIFQFKIYCERRKP